MNISQISIYTDSVIGLLKKECSVRPHNKAESSKGAYQLGYQWKFNVLQKNVSSAPTVPFLFNAYLCLITVWKKMCTV